MVCQNQSIDDSEAPLAHDLRVLVRDRLKAGDSDAQVSIIWSRATASSCCCGRRCDVAHRGPVGNAAGVLLVGIVTIIVVAGRRRNCLRESRDLSPLKKRGSRKFCRRS